MHRLFVTGSGISEEIQALFSAEECLFEMGDPADTPAQLIDKLRAFKPDGLIVRQGRITAEVQAAYPGLRVICKHGVGTDNIDIEAATERGIPVFFAPGATTETVAEHTLGLMFAVTRLIAAQDRDIRKGVFSKKDYAGGELYEKRLGIVGFGQIGRRLSELVEPLRMEVLAYHPSQSDESLPPHVRKAKQVDDVFSHADVLSLHCPLTVDTRGLVNADRIALMRRGAIIINTARGGLIPERDLVDALASGVISGAGLDCFEDEPLPPDSQLLEFETVVMTAHVAGASDRSLRRIGTTAVRHVLSVLNGEPADRTGLLNPSVLRSTRN